MLRFTCGVCSQRTALCSPRGRALPFYQHSGVLPLERYAFLLARTHFTSPYSRCRTTSTPVRLFWRARTDNDATGGRLGHCGVRTAPRAARFCARVPPLPLWVSSIRERCLQPGMPIFQFCRCSSPDITTTSAHSTAAFYSFSAAALRARPATATAVYTEQRLQTVGVLLL